MEFTIRSRILCRLLRKPFGTNFLRAVTSTAGTAVKEDVNVELMQSFNRDIKQGGAVPVFRRALLFPSRVALQDDLGTYTYAGLYQAASALCTEISMQLAGDTDRTIAYMCSNDASHVIVQWAIWMSGNIAVPLTPLHPPDMLKYFLQDSLVNLVVCTQEYEKTLRPITLDVSVPLLITNRDKQITAQLYQPDGVFMKSKPEDILADVGRSNAWYGDNDAMIIYTSGTTSKPKGVVWTHQMLQTQISALHSAWQYSASDVVLHVLPLHHIHGQLNSMLATLAAGARLRMCASPAAHAVWARLVALGEREEARVSVLHAVPALYARLVEAHAALFPEPRAAGYVRAALKRMRLVCAGSAPLPAALAARWEQISGIKLLERYGMTEVGMALSNPYRPVEGRAVGCVGRPLPGVAARLAAKGEGPGLRPLLTAETPAPETRISLDRLGIQTSEDFFVDSEQYDWGPTVVTKHVEAEGDVYVGELLIKGPGVFTRYWNRAPTLESTDFTSDGWFRTGDTASYEDGRFRILGRTSIDIIKTSGYKVSALQVESAILEHSSVSDVAVLGIPDDTYGEIVSAVVVLKDKAKLTLPELKTVAGKLLAPYQLPKTMIIIEQMPRNAMGKLDKKTIRELYGKDLALKKKP